MKKKIVHFSDWHNDWRKLPAADIYVCTGDMYDNYPKVCFDSYGAFTEINKEKEINCQNHWLKSLKESKKKTLRQKFFGSPDAPVVCVRGNHDFIPLSGMFGGDVFEVNSPDDMFEVEGIRFSGFRGVGPINGSWSDEKTNEEMQMTVSSLSKHLDVVISHTPPAGILDSFEGNCYGSAALSSWINSRMIEENCPKLFCFGHIHMAPTIREIEGVIFSNAATGYNEIEIEVSDD